MRVVLLLLVWLQPIAVRADGGVVRWSGRAGAYAVTVFTTPTPLRVGPVDVSVLVQEATTLRPMPDARVVLELTSPDRTSFHFAATREASANKLMTAAQFDWPCAGRWHVTARIDGKHGQEKAQFDVEVHDPLPHWQELWAWIALPFAVAGLYALLQKYARPLRISRQQ